MNIPDGDATRAGAGRLFPWWTLPQPRLLKTWNLRFPGSASGAASASGSCSTSGSRTTSGSAFGSTLQMRPRAPHSGARPVRLLFPSPPCADLTPWSIFWSTSSQTSWHHVVPAGLLVPRTPWGGPADTRPPASAPRAPSPARKPHIYLRHASFHARCVTSDQQSGSGTHS